MENGAAAAAAAPAPPPAPAPPINGGAVFDPLQPAAFYLCGNQADMEVTADATAVVEGVRLPVHTQVLSLQSGVLRGLFVEFLGGGGGSKKRKAVSQDELVLEEPFKDASLHTAALFLRRCYRAHELSAANLAGALDSLPGLLHLAHKLDAPLIQDTVAASMAEHAASASLSQLLDWAEAADACQLPELHMRCLIGAARHLVHSGDLARTFALAGTVGGQRYQHLLPQLLALVAGTAALNAGVSMDNSCGSWPTAADAVVALQQAPNEGSFQWSLEKFSAQATTVGASVCSPWLWAAGIKWRLKVYPGGYDAASAGFFSVFLHCDTPGTRAKFSITAVDRGAEPQHIEKNDFTHTFIEGAMGYGRPKFASLAKLRSRTGYLAGDRLLLRVRVEVLPPAAAAE